MNCVNCYVQPQKVSYIEQVTIIDVFDEYALSSPVREEIYKFYPHAKLANLKSGGNFPYLSRSDEINLHLQVPINFLTLLILVVKSAYVILIKNVDFCSIAHIAMLIFIVCI